MSLTVSATPRPNLDEAKNIVLGILEEAGGTLIGASRLNKAFWLAHLIYWQEHEGRLSSHPIVKLPDGPGIEWREEILRQLTDEGRIQRSTFKKRGEKYQLIGDGPTLSDSERQAIGKALKVLGARGYKGLSEWSHRQSWKAAELGEQQDYYLDLLTDDQVEQIRSSYSETKRVFEQALKG